MKGEGPGVHCRGHICCAIAERLSRKLRKLARGKEGSLAGGSRKHAGRDMDTRVPFVKMARGTAVFEPVK